MQGKYYNRTKTLLFDFSNGQAQGVELGKFALYYSLKQPGPHTYLVGSNTVEVLNKNLDVVFNGIIPKEQEVLDYLTER